MKIALLFTAILSMVPSSGFAHEANEVSPGERKENCLRHQETLQSEIEAHVNLLQEAISAVEQAKKDGLARADQLHLALAYDEKLTPYDNSADKRLAFLKAFMTSEFCMSVGDAKKIAELSQAYEIDRVELQKRWGGILGSLLGI